MKKLPAKYGVVKIGKKEYIYKRSTPREVERIKWNLWKNRILGELKEDGNITWKKPRKYSETTSL